LARRCFGAVLVFGRGVDFPEPGCWEIFAEYLGQTLTFVVETVDTDVDAKVAR
jgi:hypothetical protein